MTEPQKLSYEERRKIALANIREDEKRLSAEIVKRAKALDLPEGVMIATSESGRFINAKYLSSDDRHHTLAEFAVGHVYGSRWGADIKTLKVEVIVARGNWPRDKRHYRTRKDGTINIDKALKVYVEYINDQIMKIEDAIVRSDQLDNWREQAKREIEAIEGGTFGRGDGKISFSDAFRPVIDIRRGRGSDGEFYDVTVRVGTVSAEQLESLADAIRQWISEG